MRYSSSTRARASLAALVCSATTLVFTAHGCGELAPPTSVTVDAALDVRDATAEWVRPPCVPPPRPEGVPAGWELATDYEACCGFYVPAAAEQLPPPMKWAACDVEQPNGILCRQVLSDWDAPSDARGTATGRHVWVQADGTVTMLTTRMVAGPTELWTYSLIADADGPVHKAFLQTRASRCLAFSEDIGAGFYVYRVREFESSYNGGALAGEITALAPKGFLHFNDGIAHAFAVGTPGVVNWTGSLSLYPWHTPDQGLLFGSSEKEDGRQQRNPVFAGSTIFWQSASLLSAKTKIYTPNAGTRDFISSGSGSYKGAADFGTDGKNMVWLEESGTPSREGLFPVVSFMAAPYTEDPAMVAPRRLRSEIPNGVGVSQTVVGCGYAARAIYSGIRIVRIADGVSWFLSNVGTWHWRDPLGLTCDELFAGYSLNQDPSVARIRLDSLGPGEPAD